MTTPTTIPELEEAIAYHTRKAGYWQSCPNVHAYHLRLVGEMQEKLDALRKAKEQRKEAA